LLPVYKAINKVSNLTGGSSKPWLINVLADGVPKPFVVKMFPEKDINAAQSVAREVFGSILADALDLTRPNPALVIFDEDFVSTLSNVDKEFLGAVDGRIKFASEFIEGSVSFTANTPRSTLERYEVENIYAFDNLIFNVDRKNRKPNILLLNRDYYLIDHELSLPINQRTIINFESEHSVYDFKSHIFYKYLKRSKPENKTNYFDSFEEIIRFSRIEDCLAKYKDQLIQHKHPVGEFDILIDYLGTARKKSAIFTSILKKQVG
jgi:hypothetical protein